MSTPSRWDHAPAEQAAHNARLEAAGQVAEDLAADLHHGEVLAAHTGSPSPAEMIGRGVTPAPGG